MRAVRLDHIHFSSETGACDGEGGGLAVDEREVIVERRPRSTNGDPYIFGHGPFKLFYDLILSLFVSL